MTPPETDQQLNLLRWVEDLEAERRQTETINAERRARRGFIIIATDPTVDVDSSDYRRIYATEAKTLGQATAKVRPVAEGRRLRAYLATGSYRHELADARWVA